jgi:hypothetical protein
MNQFIQGIFQLQTPFNMVVLIILIGSAAGIISGLFKQIRKYACYHQELNFKREMLDRGLSTEEIEQIVRAKAPERRWGDS